MLKTKGDKMEETYVSAFSGIKNNVIYKGNNGNLYEASGGTKAWRNNNPGNIEDGKFARNNGAIGSDGRFAIFPNSDIGWNAMVSLLSNDSYQRLTIAEAINRYAPSSENDVESYLKSLEFQTGFSRSTPMYNLSKDNLLELAKAMKKHESFLPGKKRLIPKSEKYIWVTQGDGKVRPEHKALNGQQRSWYDTPHPGEEYGCRCYAKPVE